MDYLKLLLTVLYSLVIIGVMVKVIIDNRQPSKTMAWMLVLTFIPVLGIILYFFFGQNTRRQRLVSQRSLDQLSKRSMLEFVGQPNLKLPELYRPLMSLFASQNGALPFKDNEVEIFSSGADFFLYLFQAIGRAKDHIHIDTYIFEDDALGRLLSDMLIDKRREGVEVRVIYDDVGCWNVKNKFFERMREEGIEVRPFMPVKFPIFTSKANYRNHRKMIVIDGSVGFIGGMNIAIRYVKGTKTQPWRDTHIAIRGGAVYGLQKAVLVDWFFVDQTLISNRKYYPAQEEVEPNNCVCQIVTSSPTSSTADIEQGFVKIITQARRYVYIETPYFLPTEPVMFALKTAAQSGIDVKIIVPLRTDAKFVEWASRSYVAEAIAAGIAMYLYYDGFNHSKFMVCDDFVCTCGSTNVDFRSFENNFEGNAFFYDEGVSLRLKHLFLEDEKHCVKAEEHKLYKNPKFIDRFRDSIVRIFSPLM